MYLFKRLRTIYETADYMTTDAIISRYILNHIQEIDSLRVSQIAKETAISKSTVSKFFKDLSFDGGFTMFQSALTTELHNAFLDYNTLKRDAAYLQDYWHKLNLHEHISLDDIHQFDLAMEHAKKIIFCGNCSKKSYFDRLINFLILQGKDVKFSDWCYSRQQIVDLESLTSEDLLVVVEPNYSLYDFYLRLSTCVDIMPDIENMQAVKYYLGRPSQNTHQFNTISISGIKNVFIDDIILEMCIAQIILDYVK